MNLVKVLVLAASVVSTAAVAATAFDRLDLAWHIAERLDTDVMLPQVAQAALAVECRQDDQETRALLALIEHAPTRRAVDAERGFLSELGGDCSLPAAAYATTAGGTVRLRGLLSSPDGVVVVRHELSGPVESGPALGRRLARHLLDDQDGAKLLGRVV